MDSRTYQPKIIYGRSSPRKPVVPTPVPTANPPDQFGPLSNELEKELTCSICTSILHHPITLLDCLHSYCGACAKEWFTPQPGSTHSAAYAIPKGCPTCRQAVRAIKPSNHLSSMVEIYLKYNPQLARDKEEIARLASIYSPGDRISVDRSSGDREGRGPGNPSNRRAGEGWWDGLLDEPDSEDDQFYAAISASIRDLIPLTSDGSRTSSSVISLRSGNSTLTTIGTNSSHTSILSPLAMRRNRHHINCDSCQERFIGSFIHYHCSLCQNDDYDICQTCFQRGIRCLAPNSGNHQMIARRYNTETNQMEKGIFCDTPNCGKNCNEMFWSCDNCITNVGSTFKYCQDCVNHATCCDHELIAYSTNPAILAQCGLSSDRSPITQAGNLVEPQAVRVTTRCDLCSDPITPTTSYFHCRACSGADWDCHVSCLYNYIPRRTDGVPKCISQHPLQTLVQMPMPNPQNPTHFTRRVIPSP